VVRGYINEGNLEAHRKGASAIPFLRTQLLAALPLGLSFVSDLLERVPLLSEVGQPVSKFFFFRALGLDVPILDFQIGLDSFESFAGLLEFVLQSVRSLVKRSVSVASTGPMMRSRRSSLHLSFDSWEEATRSATVESSRSGSPLVVTQSFCRMNSCVNVSVISSTHPSSASVFTDASSLPSAARTARRTEVRFVSFRLARTVTHGESV
jgi:hypothetical protein